MKKIISILLAISLILCFEACAKQNETGNSTEPSTELLSGGWQTPVSFGEPDVEEEIVKIFNDACAESEKQLTLVALLGTQVVSGTNYAFLCTENGSLKVAVAYAGADGSREIISLHEFDYTSIKDSVQSDKEPLAGGWFVGEDVEDSDIDESAEEALEKAAVAGMNYEPLALLGTQVVAGTNYLILCKGEPVVPNAEAQIYLVTVYSELDGSANITSSIPVSISDFTV